MEDYFYWLGDLVRLQDYPNMEPILRRMFQIPYHSDILVDGNIISDTLLLRGYYKSERGVFPMVYDLGSPDAVSVLELFVWLARLFETNAAQHDPEWGDTTWVWFWVFMMNTGFDLARSDMEVDELVNGWMAHNFNPDGTGSLAGTVTHPAVVGRVDYTKCTLWGQVQGFAISYYPTSTLSGWDPPKPPPVVTPGFRS